MPSSFIAKIIPLIKTHDTRQSEDNQADWHHRNPSWRSCKIFTPAFHKSWMDVSTGVVAGNLAGTNGNNLLDKSIITTRSNRSTNRYPLSPTTRLVQQVRNSNGFTMHFVSLKKKKSFKSKAWLHSSINFSICTHYLMVLLGTWIRALTHKPLFSGSWLPLFW